MKYVVSSTELDEVELGFKPALRVGGPRINFSCHLKCNRLWSDKLLSDSLCSPLQRTTTSSRSTASHSRQQLDFLVHQTPRRGPRKRIRLGSVRTHFRAGRFSVRRADSQFAMCDHSTVPAVAPTHHWRLRNPQPQRRTLLKRSRHRKIRSRSPDALAYQVRELQTIDARSTPRRRRPSRNLRRRRMSSIRTRVVAAPRWDVHLRRPSRDRFGWRTCEDYRLARFSTSIRSRSEERRVGKECRSR